MDNVIQRAVLTEAINLADRYDQDDKQQPGDGTITTCGVGHVRHHARIELSPDGTLWPKETTYAQNNLIRALLYADPKTSPTVTERFVRAEAEKMAVAGEITLKN